MSRREGDYEFRLLRRDPLLAWVPKDHPRVNAGFYPLRDFEADSYIETYPGQETDNNRAFQANGITVRSQYLSKDVQATRAMVAAGLDVQATRAMVAAGLGVSLNNAILAYGLDLSDIVTLPTQPSAEVEIGIAAPKRENRSPAAEQFLRYALDHLPEPSPVSFRTNISL